MKKLLSIVIALALTLSFCAAETQDITGEWYANVFGMNITLTVNADGTCSLLYPGEDPDEGVWVIEGDQILINKGLEDESSMAIGEGSLTVEEQGITLEFTREPVAAFEMPAVVAANDIADFNGSYVAAYLVLSMDGQNMTVDIASAMTMGIGNLLGVDQDFSLIIENGSTSVFGQEAQTFAFTDGKLTVPSPSEDTPELAQNIELLADGSVVYTLMTFQFVFTPAE